jgi:hypothetical protein
MQVEEEFPVSVLRLLDVALEDRKQDARKRLQFHRNILEKWPGVAGCLLD